jgi:hypothetical protein
MKTRKEFVADLRNCKDIEELFKCLSSAAAHMNYQICLIKRDDTQDGFNENFAKEIILRDFLTEWVSDNEGFFIDDIKYLIDLIIITNNYLVNKYQRTLDTAYKRTPYKQRLNDTKKYQDSIKKHLEAVKRDLQEIHPRGGKTKSLLDSINEALNDINSIVPIVNVSNANADDLRTYLTKLETKIGLTKVAAREYIKFFQGYNTLEVADNFYFSKDTTHITS